MLARMIMAAPSRIVAVVGGEDAEVVGAHLGCDLGQARVEGFEARGVARDVAAVAVFAVEIDEIDEDEAAVGGFAQRGERQVDVFAVVPAFDFAPGAAMGEDVADLADRDDFTASARRALEEVPGQRRHREILAMGGAHEITRRAPDEGAGDDAPDRERIA